MAKADIKASSKGISTSADRGSGSEPKWERSTRKRLSAERSLRTSPGARAIVSHFLDPGGKMGSSGEHDGGWIREMGDQKQRLFKGKTPGRELLEFTRGDQRKADRDHQRLSAMIGRCKKKGASETELSPLRKARRRTPSKDPFDP